MDVVQRAKELAHRAHAGQVDKAGRPYIEHVARVAAAVRVPGHVNCSGCDEAETVAWLHDVWEDRPDFNNWILPRWLPMQMVQAVQALNRNNATGTDAYFRAVKNDAIALRVKLADIADNSDEDRLALLSPAVADRLRKKYARARRALGVES